MMVPTVYRPSLGAAKSISCGLIACMLLVGCQKHRAIDYRGPISGWPQWGGSDGGLHFSPLTQVDRENVSRLQVAWTYRIGGLTNARDGDLPALEATPIMAEGRLYLCSSLNKVVALDPETGRELWSYDPKIRTEGKVLLNCRGVTYYRDEYADPGRACVARILLGTLDGRLLALDAATGQRCRDFGADGTVDLLAGLGQVRPGEYGVSSPPVIAAGRIIVGGYVVDNMRNDVPAGVIRAFDVHTGVLSWAWNPLPPGRLDAELAPRGETYARGTANAWAPFSVDRERGLVFIPTGNTSPDYFGGMRHGLDYYSSSVVALEASTGRVVWHFQTVHHDLWDYDVPAQPVLFDFPTDHGPVPALAQPTKQGNIFILDRTSGVPLVAVEERPAPQGGAVIDETPAPTQPIPSNPAYVLHPGDLTEADMWGFTPWDRGKCREQFRKFRYQGLYTPPSLQGSILFPHGLGIMNWGGIAIDPRRDLLIVNTSRVPTSILLVPRKDADSMIKVGEALGPMLGTPYAFKIRPLLSPFGAPCNAPPWGTLTAIDLRAGKRVWEVPLGTTRDVAPFPFWFKLGVPSLGGPLITASGVVFIAATTDNFIRAFDIDSGKTLWEARLPAGGQATPMTYRLRPDGKQYIVIAAGGNKMLKTTLGDYFVAYSLRD